MDRSFRPQQVYILVEGKKKTEKQTNKIFTLLFEKGNWENWSKGEWVLWDREGIVLSIRESLGRLQWSKDLEEVREGVKSLPGSGWASAKALMFKEQ